ncbi:MAG: VWA domain-containing protein [Bacteroidaceae bacterium]|nr:VWA domain-containing protein [Candidatus Minthousia equi]MCQ2245864.1 VWA domain-containing protein [Bacteroidaceae bacterium]MDO4957464.1 VWA domain-containing protein [Bacteroidales bacterium]
MTFANILYLLLLIPLLAYIAWYIIGNKKTTPSLKVPDTHAYIDAPFSWRVAMIHVPFVLRVFAYVMIVLALCRPQTRTDWSNKEVEGIDIMLAMDISTSMLAQDLKPNRVEAAKQVASSFIANRPTDNIGLTFFAGDAFTQCPMTMDHAVVLNFLKKMGCEDVQRGLIQDGTAMGMGIANALTRLESSKAKSRIIILLTDGVNNLGDISPLTAAEMAKSYGVRVYTIGVGKNGLAPYPYPVGDSYQIVNLPVEIDETTLKQIAQTTDGHFYRATNNEELEKVYEDIDKLEKSRMKVHEFNKKYECFHWFVMAALIALLLELLLRELVLRRIP